MKESDYSPEAFGRVVKRLRGAKTQAQLARDADYHGKKANITISRIENGKALPSSERMDGLARGLDVSREELESLARQEQSEIDTKGSARGLSVQSVRAALVGSQKIDNERREGRLTGEIETLREEHKESLGAVSMAVDRARDKFLLPFFDLSEHLEGLPNPVSSSQDFPTGKGEVAPDIKFNRDSVRANVMTTLGNSAAAGGAGAAAGGVAAVATYAAVGSFATASTGTAIAGLTGAAASSATLAWLGGGSLAAGGLGVAGGTAVLTGILALPAAVAFGAALIYQGRKIRKQAREEAAALDLAEAEVQATRAVLEQAWRWAAQGSRIMTDATLEGASRLGRLSVVLSPSQSEEGPTARVAYCDLTPDEQRVIDECINLATIILVVQALPIWLRVASTSGEEPLGQGQMERWRDWNDQALIDAQDELAALTNRP